MALYRLLIKASAGKELAKAGSKADRVRIVEKVGGLANDPRPHGSEKLAGFADRYRLRQGNYRIVHLIDDKQNIVTLYKVGDRKDIHK